MSHPISAGLGILLACFSLSLGLACTGPCQGPGCESLYAGALLTVHRGATIGVGTLDPLVAEASLEGSAEQGPDWAAALLPGRLLVGIPSTSTITELSLETGGTLAFLADQGTILGEPTEALGASLARLGDQDGDGRAELLAGAPGVRRTPDSFDDGAVLLFSGLGEGLGRSWAPEEATLTVRGEEPGGRLGTVTAACGDVDGDGLSDWAAAAPRADSAVALSGRVLLGRSTETAGLDPTIEADALASSWFGGQLGARAGSSLDCLSDLTGDGLADLVVGVPFADGEVEAGGAVHVLAGGAVMATGGTGRLLEEAAVRSFEGTLEEEWLGRSVATGDLDGDGRAELIAGAPGWSGQTGRVKIWVAGARQTLPDRLVAAVLGEAEGDAFGRTVVATDLDQDGALELLVGAPQHNPDPDDAETAYDSGKLYALPGDAARSWWQAGISASLVADPVWVRPQAYLRTGQALVLGDYDTDGIPDLVFVHRTDPD